MKKKFFSAIAVTISMLASGASPAGALTARSQLETAAGGAGLSSVPVPDAGAHAVQEISGAEDGILLNAPGQTFFEKLEALYEQGTIPSKRRWRGYFSGRIVHADAPDTVKAGLLVGTKDSDQNNGGPLFEKWAMMIFTANHEPSYFDYSKMNGSKVSRVLRMVKSVAPLVSEPEVSEEHEAVAWTNTDYPGYKFLLRRNGRYLVLRLVREEGDAFYAYFFNNISLWFQNR